MKIRRTVKRTCKNKKKHYPEMTSPEKIFPVITTLKNELREPPHKIAKIERFSDDDFKRNGITSNFTPMSPDNHHQRPPTPPETPEGQQNSLLNNIVIEDAKLEEIPIQEDYEQSHKNMMNIDHNSDEDIDDDDDESMTIYQEDSESPLEVDTSHDTEMELDVENDESDPKQLFNDRGSSVKIFKDNNIITSHNKSECNNRLKYETDMQDSKVKRNTNVQVGQIYSSSFPDSDTYEDKEQTGALDLSSHARNVREARDKNDSEQNVGKVTEDITSITQNTLSKNEQKTSNDETNLMDNNITWPQSIANYSSNFHDLLTLSQAAVLQIAIAQTKSKEVHNKNNKLKDNKKENDDTLNITNDSGDTLTISAIKQKQLKSNDRERSVKNRSNTITIQRTGKEERKPKLNKSVSHNPTQFTTKSDSKISSQRSKSTEKDDERTGDPIFKITSKKLSECFRQQMTNKMKQNSSQNEITDSQMTKNVNGQMPKSSPQCTNLNKTPYDSKLGTQSDIKCTSNMFSSTSITVGNRDESIPCKSSKPLKKSLCAKSNNCSNGITNNHINTHSNKSERNGNAINFPNTKPLKISNKVISPISNSDSFKSKTTNGNNSKGSNTTSFEYTNMNLMKKMPSVTIKPVSQLMSEHFVSKKDSIKKDTSQNHVNSRKYDEKMSAFDKLKQSSLSTNEKSDKINNIFKQLSFSNGSITSSCSISPSSSSLITGIPLTTSSKNSSSIFPLRQPSLSSTISKPLNIPTFNGLTSKPRTSSTNSSSVRGTNSSVRQIPNPSFLHHQSETRLMGGRLESVLGRLSNSSTGMSRLESVTRSLHEKAAAAINTAAR